MVVLGPMQGWRVAGLQQELDLGPRSRKNWELSEQAVEVLLWGVQGQLLRSPGGSVPWEGEVAGVAVTPLSS